MNDTVEKRDLKWTLAWFTSSDGVSLKDHEVFTVIFTCIEELAQKAATLQAAYDVLSGELREVKARLDTLSALHADCMASCVCYQRGYRKGNEAMARTLMWEPKA